jgi:hypothetical protein
MLTKKLLKGKTKSSLSASEKSRIEARVSMMMSTMKNLPAKLLPKIRELERNRLMDKGKK